MTTDDPLLIETAQTIVNRMLSESAWFDMCAVTKAADLLGVYKQSPRFKALRKYHCVDWRDMPNELRTRVLAELAGAFGEYAPKIKMQGATVYEAPRPPIEHERPPKRGLLQLLGSKK